ncbi:histidine kinase-like protein [Cellulomonas sp. SLBN-39]|nr:histidine kinase-like protein [Cellulomonas sp. SLBN-39]
MVNSHARSDVSSVDRTPSAGPSTALLARALDASPVPTAVLDAGAGLRVVWSNAALDAATGYRPGDLVGVDVLADPRVRVPDPATLRDALRGGAAFSPRVVLRRADGAHVPCEAHLAPVDGTTWVVALEDLRALRSERAEHVARVAAEQRERRALALVSRVSDLVMDVDEPHALREIAALLAGEVVAWAGFYLDDRGLWAADGLDPRRPSVRPRPASVHAPGTDPVGGLLAGRVTGPVELDLGAPWAAGSSTAWLVDQLVDRLAGVGGGAAGGAAPLVIAVPGRRRTVGLLVVLPRDDGGVAGLDAPTRTVLELTARRVGLSVDNVRLYDREHRLAETLQRSMLPEQGEVDGLDVWTYYSPNADDAQVGGDWYDVLQLGPDTAGVVVGDVVGHDVEAAAAMGQLRSVVRSSLVDATDAGRALDRVDHLVAGMRVPRPASMVLSVLERTAGAWRAGLARAGHLPVLLVREGQASLLQGTGGPLVGFGGAGRSADVVDLLPGDVLVYYTDGLVERRDRSLRDGLAVLVGVAAQVTARDAAGIGEELLARLADHPEDDVAVVVVRVPHDHDDRRTWPSPRQRRWRLPSEPASIARARHAVLRTCQAWDLPDAANAELVVSELVANAVLHGWGHVSLQLHDTGDGLRVEVEDANPTPPVTTDGHPGRVGGFGMTIVERLADWGWRPSRAGKVVWARVRPGALPRPGADGR